MHVETTRNDGVAVTVAESSQAWRDWLLNNHANTPSVWLIIFKKSSQIASITYDQAVDEALCFGWIDSKPNKRDELSYYQYFSQRSPKSNWSRVNKQKVARLQAAGKMQPPGLEMIKVAKENGSWDALNDVENLVIPADMLAEFELYERSARENWEQFPRSVKRGILEWIFNAKRPATRAKRIKETVELASQNKRANQYR
ncbi:MAG: YdeI/OmpD-associated family protein [Bacteroidota bacterium]